MPSGLRVNSSHVSILKDPLLFLLYQLDHRVFLDCALTTFLPLRNRHPSELLLQSFGIMFTVFGVQLSRFMRNI